LTCLKRDATRLRFSVPRPLFCTPPCPPLPLSLSLSLFLSLSPLSLSLSLAFFAASIPLGVVLSFSLRLSLGETFIGSSLRRRSLQHRRREVGWSGGREAKYSLVFISTPNEFAGRFSRMHARIHADRRNARRDATRCGAARSVRRRGRSGRLNSRNRKRSLSSRLPRGRNRGIRTVTRARALAFRYFRHVPLFLREPRLRRARVKGVSGSTSPSPLSFNTIPFLPSVPLYTFSPSSSFSSFCTFLRRRRSLLSPACISPRSFCAVLKRRKKRGR